MDSSITPGSEADQDPRPVVPGFKICGRPAPDSIVTTSVFRWDTPHPTLWSLPCRSHPRCLIPLSRCLSGLLPPSSSPPLSFSLVSLVSVSVFLSLSVPLSVFVSVFLPSYLSLLFSLLVSQSRQDPAPLQGWFHRQPSLALLRPQDEEERGAEHPWQQVHTVQATRDTCLEVGPARTFLSGQSRVPSRVPCGESGL